LSLLDQYHVDAKPVATGGHPGTLTSQGVVFKIDPSAKPGNTPIVGRLLRFGSSR
jgi:hypothetical protein